MSNIPLIGQNQPSSNPLTVLNEHLSQVNAHLGTLVEHTRPKDQHIYAIAPSSAGWGAFCLACSEAKQEYVWPCEDMIAMPPDTPPQFFKIAPGIVDGPSVP